jgi:hypothetical protein
MELNNNIIGAHKGKERPGAAAEIMNLMNLIKT